MSSVSGIKSYQDLLTSSVSEDSTPPLSECSPPSPPAPGPRWQTAHAAVLAPVGDHINGDQLKGRDIDDQKRTHFITGRSPSEGPRLFCLLRSSSRFSSSSMAFSPRESPPSPGPAYWRSYWWRYGPPPDGPPAYPEIKSGSPASSFLSAPG